ncbi:F-box/LRR-repeat protein 12-like [Papaver somniferum]|uniref:F-box/LRR-repeat protein 12-like n=1 Tax=Papaver somniferum TaxID=3469 RepID=UPI000E6F7EBF|nr:F-box/LRR-repeat protein 12-like [Papaver somniferum]
MRLSSSNTYNIGLGKLLIKKRKRKNGLRKLQLTSKATQENRLIGYMHPCKRLSITDLPDDCLGLVYQSLKSGTDLSSFGLVCRHWFHIQNCNHESLWDIDNSKCSLRESPKISPESFSIILCKLLIGFQHLKRFCLSGLPEVTNYITSKSQYFGSKIQFLCLKYISEYSDKKNSLIFSSFPSLGSVYLNGSNINDKGLEVLAKSCASLEKVDLEKCKQISDTSLEVLTKNCASLKKLDLGYCHRITDKGLEILAKNGAFLEEINLIFCQRITDKGLIVLAKDCASFKKVGLGYCRKITSKGLEILAKSCASLEKVDLTNCQGITDSGINFLIQNCSKIHTVRISYCSNVTGVGFPGCPKTLTNVDAFDVCTLTIEGIKAITSGDGIESLSLSVVNAINDEAITTISKGCPILESLWLDSCHGVQLEGWKAIGLHCRNLIDLYLFKCSNLCPSGLKASCYLFKCSNFPV